MGGGQGGMAARGAQQATSSPRSPGATDTARTGTSGATHQSSASGRQAAGGSQFGGAGPVAVVAVRVREGVFEDSVTALGTAHANESIDVTSKAANRVVSIRFTEGQQVKRGDVLVEMDGEEARADLAVAEAALADSRSQYNRSRELYTTKVLSESQLEQIEATLKQNEARVAAARARLNDTIVRAPFAGRVGLRNVSVGSYVSPTTVITTLDDTSVIKLDFTVPETYLRMLSEGLEVQASTLAFPGQQFKGRVSGIDTRVDPVSRSITVRGLLDNRDGRLKPGMFMTVRLVRESQRALSLPEQALVPEDNRQFVYVVRDEQAHKTEVTTGRRRPGEVEVVKGLAQGDLVVVEGTQKVNDGQRVRTSIAEPRGREAAT